VHTNIPCCAARACALEYQLVSTDRKHEVKYSLQLSAAYRTSRMFHDRFWRAGQLIDGFRNILWI
jgi:hypothetical protein